MPRLTREGPARPGRVAGGPVVVDLSGERARHLAARLLAGRADPERLLADLAALTGGAGRVAHDWDPATGRLVIAAGR